MVEVTRCDRLRGCADSSPMAGKGCGTSSVDLDIDSSTEVVDAGTFRSWTKSMGP